MKLLHLAAAALPALLAATASAAPALQRRSCASAHTDAAHAFLRVDYMSVVGDGGVDVEVTVVDSNCDRVDHFDPIAAGKNHPDPGDCIWYDGAPYAVCLRDLRGAYGLDGGHFIEFDVGAARFGIDEGSCDCYDTSFGLVASTTCDCLFLKVGK